jgi:hypothetical protein
MYSLLYSKLPGGRLAKGLQLLGLAAVVITFLFFVAFPLFDSLFIQDPSIDG